jgi:hypothetical protein
MQLKIFQSTWGLRELPWRGEREWTLEERIEAAAGAGFDGLNISDEDPDLRRIIALLAEHGMSWVISTFPETVADLQPALDLVSEIGAEHMNIQPMPRPARVLDAIPFLIGWQKLADKAGIPIRFETHRDRLTTDLLFTLQVIDAVPDVLLTADLSHYLVGREFRHPVSDENHALIHRILDRTDSFHGRVASREQVQVSIGFPQHQRWVDLFLDWWEEGFRRWRARAAPDATCVFVVELGPPPDYSITGPDGLELSDRWAEALQMRDLVRERWDKVEREG